MKQTSLETGIYGEPEDICHVNLQIGDTALHNSAWNGRTDAARVLIGHGASLEAENQVFLDFLGYGRNLCFFQCIIDSNKSGHTS